MNPYETTQNSFQNERCFFPCSADIYGLGIRLGIYLQWLGTYIANRYCPEAIGELLDTNTLFLFALLVATILVSVQEDDIHPVEIMVVLYIMFGGLASIFTIKGYRTLLRPRHPTDFHFSLFGIMVRTYLRAAISAYAIWFLFSGIYEFAPAPCSSDIFFFARLELMGSVLYLFKAFVVLCTGYDACGLIGGFWQSSVPTKLWSALLPWFTIKKIYSLIRSKETNEVSYKLLLARLWAVYSLPAHRVINQDSPHQVPKKISICLWRVGL